MLLMNKVIKHWLDRKMRETGAFLFNITKSDFVRTVWFPPVFQY